MTSDTVGGVWHYALTLALQLRRAGAEIILATMGAPMSLQQGRQARALSLQIEPSRFKLEWMQDPWKEVDEAGEWLLMLERRYGPDLIHLNHYAHGTLPWRAPVVVVGHSCVLSWWHAVHGEPAPRAYAEYAARVRRGLHGATSVVAPSRYMLEQLERHYGKLKSARVIHNGCEGGEGGTPLKDEMVLSVGRLWDQAKNVQAVMAAADQIAWPVHLAGDVSHPEGGRVWLKGVRHHGVLGPDTLGALYRRAAIYVFPALYEPFGLSVLEAALARCALVLSDLPSFRELWDGAAQFVPASDPLALAETVNRLSGDRRRCRALGDAARRRAVDYSASRTADGYLELYRSLLGERRTAAAWPRRRIAP